MEHPSTAAAFTAAGLDAHAAPEPEEKREGLDPKHASEQKKKLKKQEELWMNHRKKTPPKKLNFSTARFLKYETAADTGLTDRRKMQHARPPDKTQYRR